nr:prolyl oligopeptidase family serine peptidase [Corynebacterium sp. TAE3-ERU12]
MIHGGGWTQQSTLEGMNALASDMVSRGVAVWNIEYRGTVPGADAATDPNIGGWPGTYDDVAAAIDFIPNLHSSSPVALDLSRVVVTGISAGGNLTAWVSTRQVLPPEAPGANPGFIPLAYVPVAGVYDMALAHSRQDRFVAALLGGTPEDVPDHYRLASPAQNIDITKQLTILHGRNDQVVNVEQATVYADRIAAAGGTVDVRLFDDAAHSSWADPNAVPWQSAREAILDHLAG